MKKLSTSLAGILCVCFFAFTQAPLGNGSDGPLTINNGETISIDDSRTAVTGTNLFGSKVLNVADGSNFQPGDEILIITMQDADTNFSTNQSGMYEFNHVLATSQSQLVLADGLKNTYNADNGMKHQAVKVPNYTDVTVSGTLTCSAWDGNSGGILIFRASGTVTVNATGVVHANGKGYRGGTQYGNNDGGGQGGESWIGVGGDGGDGGDGNSNWAGTGAAGGGAGAFNYFGGKGLAGGGGGATEYRGGYGSALNGGSGGGGAGEHANGGGGGYGTFGYGGDNYNQEGKGEDGGINTSGDGGENHEGGGGGGGGTFGFDDLVRIFPGSGGGCGGRYNTTTPGFGGNGGGIVLISAKSIYNDGLIQSKGNNGNNTTNGAGAGGGGAGGSVYLQANTIDNAGTINASGGTGGYHNYYPSYGGDGGKGRIRTDYHTFNNSGTIDPAAYEENFKNISTLAVFDTPDESGPYPIESTIFDSDGNTLSGADIHYRINSTGAFVQLASMSTSDNELFTGSIPGPRNAGDKIDFYITATDGSDNYKDPVDAPATFFTFSITGNPPENLQISDNLNRSVQLDWDAPANTTNFQDYSVYRSLNANFTPNTGNRIAQNVSNLFYTDLTVKDATKYYYKVGARYNLSGDVFKYSSESSITTNDTSVITVNGKVFLEGESNHANTWVKFLKLSPSAVSDSLLTNALGEFEIELAAGNYKIIYEKTGWQTFTREADVSLIDDKKLGETTLTNLGNIIPEGNVSGVWDGLYAVTGNITVPNGDTLIIKPGSEIRFTGNYNIYVYGYLEAKGTIADTILFISAPASQNYARGQWKGIDFYNESDDNSMIEYAEIKYAEIGVYWDNALAKIKNSVIHESSDAGLHMQNGDADVIVEQCELHHNSNNGAFIYEGADPQFINCYFHHNNNGLHYDGGSDYSGGKIKHCDITKNYSRGIFCRDFTSLTIDSSSISNNYGWGLETYGLYSHMYMYNSYFNSNYGYGIRINNSSAHWTIIRMGNCLVEDNSSHGISFRYYLRTNSKIYDNVIRSNGGSGMHLEHEIDCEFYGNEIYDNNGHGIYISSSNNNAKLHHNIIAYNGGDGIHKANSSSLDIDYNTIFNNGGDGIEINHNDWTHRINNNIIANNGGWGVRANVYIDEFEFNCVFNNQAGALSNTGNFPPNTWQFGSTNPNGAQADNYLNIKNDPELSLSDAYDFELKLTSDCIDAADENVADPDGTRSDIGALYHDNGNPHNTYIIGYGNQSVSFKWDPVTIDTLQHYKVYYKLAAAPTYSVFQTTSDTVISVNGLTNNELYDFTVTGVYPSSESDYAPKVTEQPGLPHLKLNPQAFNVTIDADTVAEPLIITNTGSRDLELNFYEGAHPGYLYLDGSNDYLWVGDGDHQGALDNMNALTIESWVRVYENGWKDFISKHDDTYEFFVDPDNDRFGLRKPYQGTQFFNNYYAYFDFNLSEWYHLAVTWEENTMKFYLNGELIREYNDVPPENIPNTGHTLYIGFYNGYLYGDLKEVRIWNVARTPEQIKRFYRQPLEGNEAGLAGYWPLNTNQNNKSSYSITTNITGNQHWQSSGAPTLPKLPFKQSEKVLTIPPGESDTITYKFWDTGQSGTYVYTSPFETNIKDSTYKELELSLTYGTEVPSTPVYFSPVASTGKPYDIVITNAEIDGNSIQVGDEIGIFDDTLCVGAGIFDGSFNLVITAWERSGGPETGFTSGNNMSFVVYDNSADLEAEVENVEYFIGNGTFDYGLFSSLTLTSTIYKIQEIPVTENQFNLVSFNRLPRNASATNVFADIESMKIAYNDEGYAVIPEYGINTIGNIDFRDGYYVYGTIRDTFHYEGSSINPMEWNITVVPGRWNYISYLGENPIDIEMAFADSIKDSIEVIQNSDGNIYQPYLAVDNIHNLQPGEGYMIALRSSGNLVFNYQTTNGLKNGGFKSDDPEPEYFTSVQTGLPYNIIIEDPTINDLPLQTGDEIGAFDNGICVGSVVYTGKDKTVLTTWQGDETYQLPGFTEGNEIDVKVYSPVHEKEFSATLTSLNDNPFNLNYKGGYYSYATLNAKGNLTNPDDTTDVLFVNEITQGSFSLYPNPFSEQVSFSYELKETTHVKLTISNTLGQVVDVLVNDTQTAGKYTLFWNGNDKHPASQGMYHYLWQTDSMKKSGIIVKID